MPWQAKPPVEGTWFLNKKLPAAILRAISQKKNSKLNARDNLSWVDPTFSLVGGESEAKPPMEGTKCCLSSVDVTFDVGEGGEVVRAGWLSA